MNKKILKQIKEDLAKRKEQILADLENIAKIEGGSVKFPEYGNKPDENAQEVGDYATNIAKDKSLEITLRDINRALDNIEKNIYGICKYCKKEINEKRLIARPVASTCIECKTKLQSV